MSVEYRFEGRDRRSDYRGGPRPGRPSPPRAGDSYVPPPSNGGPGRRRSRSPEPRRRRSRSPLPREMGAGDSWRGRPRSPRRWEPRDEIRGNMRTRTPPPERVIRPRSPFESSRRPPAYSGRERSPLPSKRGREFSPAGDRGRRSPLPAKRERRVSPGYDRPRRPASPPHERQYRPVRNGRISPPTGPTADLYTPSHSPARQGRRPEPQDVRPPNRRRSLSPLPRTNQSGQSSGKESTTTSRKSSPPIHPSRLALQQPSGSDTRSSTLAPTGMLSRAPTKPAHEFSAANHRMSPPVGRTRSPPPYRARSDRVGTPPRDSRGYRSPPRRSPSPMSGVEHRHNGLNRVSSSSIQLSTPVGEATRSSNNAVTRAPPSGPAGGPRTHEPSKAMSPPSGPASVSLSMSAHNRPANSANSAPTRPRGGYGSQSFGRESSREGSYSGPPAGPRRAPSSSNHYHSANPARGPPPSSSNSSPTPMVSGGVPTGPRSSHSSGPPSHGYNPPFRSSHNSSSTTYPRTQRFAVLASVPQIVPGGKALPSGIDPKIAERLAKLDEEKKKLEVEVARMEEQSRSGLREWDRLSRESNRESFKSELAEQHVSMLAGEGGMGGAAF